MHGTWGKVEPDGKPAGMPSGGGRGRVLGPKICVCLLLGLLASLLSAASVLAAGPPTIASELYEEEVYSTRAIITGQIFPGIDGQEKVELEWRGEYAPAEKNGEAPATGSESWVLAGSDTGTYGPGGTAREQGYMRLGVEDPAVGHRRVLHHLSPNTTYYVRFFAKTKYGEATRMFKFATPAVAKPEVAHDFGNKRTTFEQTALTSNAASFKAQIESNGLETQYRFEYTSEPSNQASWKPFTSGASGIVTKAEDYAEPVARVTGLSPETVYYVRVVASNGVGATEQATYVNGAQEFNSFTTLSLRPAIVENSSQIRNVTGTSAQIAGGEIYPRGLETRWRYEWAASPLGPWLEVPGGEGLISQGEAEAAGELGPIFGMEGGLAGLSPGTTYYVRLFAENKFGEGQYVPGAPPIASLTTLAPLTADTLAVHALHGEAMRILGAVNPESLPSIAEQTVTVEGAPSGGVFTLTFAGKTTEPLAWDTPVKGVEEALDRIGLVVDVGGYGGRYRVAFMGEPGVRQPLLVGDGSGLTPSGSVAVTSAREGTEAVGVRYHLEYVSQKQYGAPGGQGGFAQATHGPEGELAGDVTPTFVGLDLPGLSPGETYEYRIVATSLAPASAPVMGATQGLTAPVPASVQEGPATSACPNEQFRVGPSADLPDCRAYEQVTPVEKGGAQELFQYQEIAAEGGVLASEDGNHVMVWNGAVNWGAGPRSGQGPYFFSRTPNGWQMTAAAAQPETGLNLLTPQVFSPNLTDVGVESAYTTSYGAGQSRTIELEAGPPGGPYAAVSIPRAQVGRGWVAASPDFTKLILQTEDHELAGKATGTTSGEDLYEWGEGQLRQVNVGVGSCGATLVDANEEGGEQGATASPRAVSADGSRVFFEATPGGECSEAKHLYVRVDGTQTVDLGAYVFTAANAAGTRVLLEKRSGEGCELFLYNDESGSPAIEHLLTLPQRPTELPHPFLVSKSMGVIYFDTSYAVAGTDAPPGLEPKDEKLEVPVNPVDVYRLDVSSKTLSFLFQYSIEDGEEGRYGMVHISHDGRYYYFVTDRLGGVPAGSSLPSKLEVNVHDQVFRYDNAENLVQCISCASPFDPEPRLSADFGSSGHQGEYYAQDGSPELQLISSNGEFAFFATAAALVPQDVDGEKPPAGFGGEFPSYMVSHSSDVYEWRRDGVDGCAMPQGCLALITSGRGGEENLLLGSAEEGRDVFIYTHSRLVAGDRDSAGDVYDVRVDGGFPPPPQRPTECEGDACSTPANPPVDATPASFTFAGAGDLAPPSKVEPAGKRASKGKPGKPAHRRTTKRGSKRRRPAGSHGVAAGRRVKHGRLAKRQRGGR